MFKIRLLEQLYTLSEGGLNARFFKRCISTIELRSTLYFRAELTAALAIAVPGESNFIRLRVVNAGPCYVGVASGEHATMQTGDLVLVSSGAAHILSGGPSELAALAAFLSAPLFDGSEPMEYGAAHSAALGRSRQALLRDRFRLCASRIHGRQPRSPRFQTRRSPAAEWTADEMAQRAAMSRSISGIAFAMRFG